MNTDRSTTVRPSRPLAHVVEPLGEHHEDALARLVALEGDAPVRGAPRPDSPEATRAWLAHVVRERRARRVFAFVGRSDAGELAGIVHLGGVSRRTALLSYWLPPSFRGRGLARAMVQPIVDHAFTQMGLARLDAFVVEENAPSRALLASLGFRLTGRVLGTTAPGATGEDAPVLAYVCPRPTHRGSAP